MQHKDLDVSSWKKLSIEMQMASIGSEIFRALQWKQKNNLSYANEANIRALELFDLSLDSTNKFSVLKEFARARELWLDFFSGKNIYHQTETSWKKYFFAFTYATQKNK